MLLYGSKKSSFLNSISHLRQINLLCIFISEFICIYSLPTSSLNNKLLQYLHLATGIFLLPHILDIKFCCRRYKSHISCISYNLVLGCFALIFIFFLTFKFFNLSPCQNTFIAIISNFTVTVSPSVRVMPCSVNAPIFYRN